MEEKSWLSNVILALGVPAFMLGLLCILLWLSEQGEVLDYDGEYAGEAAWEDYD